MVATRSTSRTNILILDRDTPIEIEYLAEGAANVVFNIRSKRIITQDDDYGQPGTATKDGIPRIDPRLKGNLLRLRKDLPSVAPVFESHQHFTEQIEPLFPPGSLVEQLLCKITPEFVERCNQELRNHEGYPNDDYLGRPKKRFDVYLAKDEGYATLITHMGYDEEHAGTEFKPKWLTQSPSAPPDAKRCRTCALRAMRHAEEGTIPESNGTSKDFCPLSLVDDDQHVLSTSLGPILGKCRGAPIDIAEFERQLLPYFHKLPLMRLLRDLQIEKDPKGIFDTDPSSLDFMTAMALRDCTFFLKDPYKIKIPNQDNSKARVEARLGDLDLKIPDGNKAQYWKDIEEQLIDEGWYTGTENNSAPEGSCVCLLWDRK
ncbi:MAG: hypothetical protein L6R37_001116 [Teloschistes peruensis]|nr:MAG: hypothetical protein L6R37_001116 [Teloschistes peruensis]